MTSVYLVGLKKDPRICNYNKFPSDNEKTLLGQDHILRTTTHGNRREKGAIPKDTRKDLTEDLVHVPETEG